MQPEKKQLEVLLMHYFRECIPEFPKGKVFPSESPDFILKMKAKFHAGIEITRLNPLNARSPDEIRMEQQILRDRIMETAKLLFLQTSKLNLFVKFLFSETVPVEPEREISVTVRAVNGIRKAIQKKKPSGFFYSFVDSEFLPAGIDSILIVHHPTLEVSIWERSNNLGISENVIDDIRHAIHKKDNKLKLYQQQNLNAYWLIIVTDRLRGAKNHNLHDKIMNHVFESLFQHVYLFDLVKSTVINLV